MFDGFFDWDDTGFDSEELNESEDWNSEEGENSDEERDETEANGERDGSSRISFGLAGRCHICNCKEYMPGSGDICRNCCHHRDRH